MKKNKIIFAVIYLAYTAIYVARINLSQAGPALIDTNVLDEIQMGILGSVFSTVYAVGRLINGGLSDRQPPQRMLTVGLLVAGLSNIFVGFFPPYIGIFLLWTANAYAQSMLWSSVLCVVSALYDKDQAKKKSSAMVTSVAMGNILGIIINTILITRLGVRFAFFVPGILTIALGALVCVFTRDIKPMEGEECSHLSMWKLLKDKTLLYMSMPAMFHGVMKENISLWMTVYVVDKFNVDLSTSSYYVLLIPVLGFLGRTVYPLSLKICRGRENTVSFVGFILCVVAAALLSLGKVGMGVSVLSLSVIYAAVSMINTSILSIYPLQYLCTGNVASVSGIMDFATYFGGGISSILYGVVIKNFGYQPMFISWAVLSFFSILVLCRINRLRAT